MARYIVDSQIDNHEKYYFIREQESQDIVLLPSKYLMHKKRSKLSPNTIRRSAGAISYYLNYIDETGIQLDDVWEMPYNKQQEHFTDYLIWLQAGLHSGDSYKKKPYNETCNAYLKEVFRFYRFSGQQDESTKQLKVLSDMRIIVHNSVGVKRTLYRNTFHGYLQEKGHIDYTEEHYGKTKYIFVKKEDLSRPFQYSMLQHRVMQMIRKNDIRDENGELLNFGTHTFRHCYGKKLTEMHIDDWMIARLLGHKTLQSVHHYRKIGNKIMADETRAVREKIDMILMDVVKEWDGYEI